MQRAIFFSMPYTKQFSRVEWAYWVEFCHATQQLWEWPVICPQYIPLPLSFPGLLHSILLMVFPSGGDGSRFLWHLLLFSCSLFLFIKPLGSIRMFFYRLYFGAVGNRWSIYQICCLPNDRVLISQETADAELQCIDYLQEFLWM